MSRSYLLDVPSEVFDDIAMGTRGILFAKRTTPYRMDDIIALRDRDDHERHIGLLVLHVTLPDPVEPVDLGEHVGLTVLRSTRLSDRLVTLIAQGDAHRNGCQGCDFELFNYPPCWRPDQVMEDRAQSTTRGR